MRLPLIFERYRNGIDAELRSVLAERHLPMYDMLRYHLGWIDREGNPTSNSTGKALRPTLCLLTCEAIAGEFQRALPAAAAVELVHNFSLVHDDIQDDDRERRHNPTVWSIWGKPQAINAGTAMRILASLALLRLADKNVPAEKILRAQRLLDESCLKVIEGQYLDISYETRLDVGVDDYLDMIDKKTAALISCPLELGALLSTNDEAVIGSFGNFGRNLGMAFQIRDDILGIWGDEEKTGKPMGSDIQRRKKSLPVVYALENAEGEAKTELLNIYQGDQAITADELNTVLRIMDSIQVQARAQNMANEYRKKAMDELDRIPLLVWARNNLADVAGFLVERDF